MNAENPGPDMEKMVMEFLAVKRAKNNPRSTTAVLKFGQAAYHFKTGDGDLGVEAERLKKAGEAIQMASVSSVSYVHYDRQMNVLVTRYVEGESLFNKLWNAFSFWKPEKKFLAGFAATAGAIGKWLRAFHELERGAEKGNADACKRSLLENIAKKSDGILRYGGGILSQKQIEGVAAFAESTLEDPSWSRPAVCAVHGDFSPSNILLGERGGCFVADFGNVHAGFSWEDAARFWSGLWEIFDARLRRRYFIGEAMEAFLRAYGFDEQAASLPAWNVLRANNSLTRIHEFVKPGFQVSWRLNRIFRKLAAPHLVWLKKIGSGR